LLISELGGEQRSSPIFSCGNAHSQKIEFLKKRWPDFTASDLDAAVKEIQQNANRTRGRICRNAIAGLGPAGICPKELLT